MTKPDHSKPISVRLGDLKPLLQKEAAENDRSLHYWVKKILKEYVSKRFVPAPPDVNTNN